MVVSVATSCQMKETKTECGLFDLGAVPFFTVVLFNQLDSMATMMGSNNGITALAMKPVCLLVDLTE